MALVFCAAAVQAVAQIRIDSVQCACASGGTGSISVIAEGSAGPFSFLWAGPGGYVSTEQNPADLPAPGQYSVTVTNAYGCAVTLEAVVPECDAVPEPMIETGAACTGAANGSVSISMPGGNTGYAFAWAGGSSGPIVTGLGAGTHCVTITNTNGCQRTTCVDIVSEQALSISGELVPICGSQAGSITVSVQGGTSPYHYQWMHNNMVIPGNPLQTNEAGQYTAEVRDVNGCRGTAVFDLPAHPAITLNASLQPASCLSNSDGAVFLIVEGDAGSYSFQWSNGAITQSLQNVPGGEYCVTVTSESGCISAECFDISTTEPQAKQPYLQELRVWAIHTTTADEALLYHAVWAQTGSNCLSLSGGMQQFDPSVLAEMEQGMRFLRIEARFSEEMAVPVLVGGENALFSDNMTSSDGINWVRLVNALPTSSLINLGMLDERLIFSGNSMEGHSLFNMNNQQGTNCVLTPQLNPITCQWEPPYDNSGWDDLHRLITDCMVINFDVNFDAGNIKAIVSGGVAPFSYVWTNEAGQQVGTSHTLFNMPAGRYCVVIKDDRGCKVEKCIELCKPIRDLIGEIIQIERPCPGQSDGSVCVTLPQDGSWSFVWQNGSTANCIEAVAAGEELCLTITEPTCMQTMEYCTKPIEALPPPSLQLISSRPACLGQYQGMLQVSANGGRGPFTYTWSNGQMGQQATGLTRGVCYGVTVTDACGQTASACYYVPAPGAVSLSTLMVTPSCGSSHNGAIELAVSGGIGLYSFTWSGPNQFSQTTQQASVFNLAPGNYSVTATDACGQTSVRNTIVPIEYYPALNAALISSQPTCSGQFAGSLTVQASGGKQPYSYSWSNGQTGATATGLTSAIYYVTVSDNCGQTIVYGFHPPSISSLQITGVETVPSCMNGQVGSITVDVEGGLPPFTFTWSGPNQFSAITNDGHIENLLSGEYGVTITDACGWNTSRYINVANTASSIELTVNEIGHICPTAAETSGFIDITAVSSSNSSLTFAWNTGRTSEDIHNLSAGNYRLTVTDQAGCQLIGVYGVLRSSFEIKGSQVRDAFCNLDNGYVEVEVQQNSPEHGQIQFQWNNGQTGPNIQNLAPGAYTVTVSDGTGCELTETYTVGDRSDISSLEIRLDDLVNSSYDGNWDGAIDISVYGDYGPYDYQWSHGATTEDISTLPRGTYTVTVTDQTTGCTATATYKIENCSYLGEFEDPYSGPYYEYVNYFNEPEISISVTPLTSLTSNDGALNATVNSGGAAYYFVEWTGPNGFYSTEEDIFNLAEGVYCLRVWNGCFETQKCQRVAYCGDFMITGQVTQSAYGEEICFFRGSAPVTINLNVQNANGNYITNWSDNQTSGHQFWETVVRRNIKYLDAWRFENGQWSYVNFVNDSPHTYRVVVRDDATCENTLYFNLNQYYTSHRIKLKEATFNTNIPGEAAALNFFQNRLQQPPFFGVYSAQPFAYAPTYEIHNECNDEWHYGFDMNNLRCLIGDTEYNCSCSNAAYTAIFAPYDGTIIPIRYVGEFNTQVSNPWNPFSGCKNVCFTMYVPNPEIPVNTTLNQPFTPFLIKRETSIPCNDANGDNDNDGVVNRNDNCPFVSNPDQADCDQDGIGDICDETPGTTVSYRYSGGSCIETVFCNGQEISSTVIEGEYRDYQRCKIIRPACGTNSEATETDAYEYCLQPLGTVNDNGQSLCRLRVRCTLNELAGWSIRKSSTPCDEHSQYPVCDFLQDDSDPDSETYLSGASGNSASSNLVDVYWEDRTWSLLRSWPNPFQGEINLETYSETTQKLYLSLHNAMGVSLLNMEIELQPGINKHRILPPAYWHEGIYTLRARDADGMQSGLILVKAGNRFNRN